MVVVFKLMVERNTKPGEGYGYGDVTGATKWMRIIIMNNKGDNKFNFINKLHFIK